MKTLTISPFEAKQRLKTEESFIIDGVKFYMDGPMMSPGELHSPFASYIAENDDDYVFCVPGEPGDSLAEDAKWLCYFNGKEIA